METNLILVSMAYSSQIEYHKTYTKNRHTFVAHSQDVAMANLDMNTASSSQYKTVNTDGTDTWNSKDIVI